MRTALTILVLVAAISCGRGKVPEVPRAIVEPCIAVTIEVVCAYVASVVPLPAELCVTLANALAELAED